MQFIRKFFLGYFIVERKLLRVTWNSTPAEEADLQIDVAIIKKVSLRSAFVSNLITRTRRNREVMKLQG